MVETGSIGFILCFELEGQKTGLKMIESLCLLVIN